MAKKILLAVGNCIDSVAAVKYAVRMTSAARDVSYTLFHLQRSAKQPRPTPR